MSWFKFKRRNRRVARLHLLDVKLRSAQVRANRIRFAMLSLTLLAVTLAGFYGCWRAGEWALNRMLFQNPAFTITRIDVHTDGNIAVDALRRWSGVRPGQNLLALDMARVKRDLEMVSAIRSVAVERVMPNTLRLRVAERDPQAQVPVARLRVGGEMDVTAFQLDKDGVVIAPLDQSQLASRPLRTNDSLPVIRGIDPREIIPGRRLKSPAIHAALQLAAAFQRSSLAANTTLLQIDITVPRVLVVTTAQQGKITFGPQDFDKQLRRWADIQDTAQKTGRTIATLDLSVSNNVPVRTVEVSTAPPTPPPNRNPQPARRRNV
jgi:cell division protein FtsQ